MAHPHDKMPSSHQKIMGCHGDIARFMYFLFIYLFLAALRLRCCARAFSSCGEQGLLFVAVRGLLIVVASLVAERRR